MPLEEDIKFYLLAAEKMNQKMIDAIKGLGEKISVSQNEQNLLKDMVKSITAKKEDANPFEDLCHKTDALITVLKEDSATKWVFEIERNELSLISKITATKHETK